MSETEYNELKGQRYYKLYQHEDNPAKGQTTGSILRSVEFEDGGDGETFAVTMYADHKGSGTTPLSLSITTRLPVDYLAEIIDTLVDIRTRAVQQRQAKDEWEMRQRMMEFMPDPPMKLEDEGR